MEREEIKEIIKKEPWQIMREEKSIENILEKFGALWKFPNRPSEPHAWLTPVFHGDSYVNLDFILSFPNLRKLISAMLGAMIEIKIKGNLKQEIDMIVSSSNSALLGEALSDRIGAIFASTEKVNQVQKWTKAFECER